jgi:hypothetical protein
MRLEKIIELFAIFAFLAVFCAFFEHFFAWFLRPFFRLFFLMIKFQKFLEAIRFIKTHI